jgi:hypothetical protein
MLREIQHAKDGHRNSLSGGGCSGRPRPLLRALKHSMQWQKHDEFSIEVDQEELYSYNVYLPLSKKCRNY